MVKAAIYLGLYAASGLIGWTAYDKLSGNDTTALDALGVNMETLSSVSSVLKPQEKTSTIYRWQDANGQWHYGSQAPGNEKYEQLEQQYAQELKMLKTLPKGVLPTRDGTAAAEEESSSFMIPGIPDMKQVAKLIKNATDMQGKMEDRKAKIDEALR